MAIQKTPFVIYNIIDLPYHKLLTKKWMVSVVDLYCFDLQMDTIMARNVQDEHSPTFQLKKFNTCSYIKEQNNTTDVFVHGRLPARADTYHGQ